MRLVSLLLLASTFLASGGIRAHASSPEFPICDSEQPDAQTFVLDELGSLALNCPTRFLSDERIPGGLRFELHAPDNTLLGQGTIDDPNELQVAERRHECDGTVADTTRSVFEYSLMFHTAIPGDQVWVIDGANQVFATATYDNGICPAVQLAPVECQVCAPEASMGCADAGAGGRGAGMVFVALAGLVALRRRRDLRVNA